jgi:outer membrane protein OmpA-like peptidoglycan-associated protein
MNKNFILPILIFTFFAFGCGLFDKFKSTSETNSNTAKVTPTVSPTPTATPEAKPTQFDKASLGTNFMAFGAGTIVVAQTSEGASSDDSARKLNDESDFGWQSAKGQTENQSVTLELPARTTFKSFVFDTEQPTNPDGRAAKDVTVEISDVSATEGFQKILETTLKDSEIKNGMENQFFPVQKEIAGRFVRYTAKNNFGSPLTVYTAELYGYGEQEPRASVGNISGTYKVSGIIGDGVHLKQEGNLIIGCYQENEGTLEGTVDGRVMTLVATEKNERAKGEKTYFVGVNVVESGRKLMYATWNWSATPKEKAYDRLLIGDKISDKVGNCPHLPNLDGTQDVVKEKLEKDLEESGKAILYGINFDFNSDVIKPESKPILDKVIALLKSKTDWKMQIAGHTDNVGSESFNQTLSEKRAASVVKYLTTAGIDASRLTSIGYGLSNPIAPNNSESERAQNRRVELVKK